MQVITAFIYVVHRLVVCFDEHSFWSTAGLPKNKRNFDSRFHWIPKEVLYDTVLEIHFSLLAYSPKVSDMPCCLTNEHHFVLYHSLACIPSSALHYHHPKFYPRLPQIRTSPFFSVSSTIFPNYSFSFFFQPGIYPFYPFLQMSTSCWSFPPLKPRMFTYCLKLLVISGEGYLASH